MHASCWQLVRFGQLGVEPRSRSASSRLASAYGVGEVLLPAYTGRGQAPSRALVAALAVARAVVIALWV